MQRLSTRQLLYRRYRVDGYSGYAAAIKAGYSQATARCSPLAKTSNLRESLEIAGLTNKRISERIVEGAFAEDLNIGHKYLETALKLRGDLNKEATNNIDKMQITVYMPQNDLNIGHAPTISP